LELSLVNVDKFSVQLVQDVTRLYQALEEIKTNAKVLNQADQTRFGEVLTIYNRLLRDISDYALTQMQHISLLKKSIAEKDIDLFLKTLSNISFKEAFDLCKRCNASKTSIHEFLTSLSRYPESNKWQWLRIVTSVVAGIVLISYVGLFVPVGIAEVAGISTVIGVNSAGYALTEIAMIFAKGDLHKSVEGLEQNAEIMISHIQKVHKSLIANLQVINDVTKKIFDNEKAEAILDEAYKSFIHTAELTTLQLHFVRK